MLEGTRQKIAHAIAPAQPRKTEIWERLHKEAGFIPILNATDVELRLAEIREWMLGKDGIEPEFDIFSATDKLKLARRVFMLFFVAGDAWARGLDNRELAGKISAFLMNYTEVGYMEEFSPDLFEEAMHLLSLCWQEMDVTHTPFYIIESKPIISPAKYTPQTQIDDSGLLDMEQRIEAMTAELEEMRRAKAQS